MYDAPINLFEQFDTMMKDVVEQQENAIYAEIVKSTGIQIDKQELIRALNNDRNQYEKGYMDARSAYHRTAEWINLKIEDTTHNITVHVKKCSCCGWEWKNPNDTYRYCPKCGAEILNRVEDELDG